jgi:hypothetical protein
MKENAMPAAANSANITAYSLSSVFLVDDVVSSAEFYRDKLGFTFDRFWGEPPCFVMVRRDAVEFMLQGVGKPGLARPNRVAAEGPCWDAYVRVTRLDALFQEYQAKGVKIVREPEVAFYDMNEFEIEDCNGYVLCFGEDTSLKP